VLRRWVWIWCLALLAACGHRAAEPAPQREPGRPDTTEAVPAEIAAKKWKFAGFFNTVKQRVQARWTPTIQQLRASDAGAPAIGPQGAYIALAVVLTHDGRVVDLAVAQSSGSEALDAGALSAFRAAAPFPAPPPQLADVRGLVKFRFGFYLDPGSERGDSFKVLRAEP
jgi:TonB family protein